MTPTQEQIEWWRTEAESQLSQAEGLRQMGHYSGCALHCQQAAELYLKFLYMYIKAEAFPKSHDLAALAEAVGCPEELLEPLAELSEDYGKARYPEVAGGPPSRLYDEDDADRAMGVASSIRAWVLERFGEQ